MSQDDLPVDLVERLQEVVDEEYGDFTSPDLPDLARFCTGAIEAVKLRSVNANSEQDPDRPAIFMLVDRPRSCAPDIAIYEPMVRNGGVQLCGRLWYAPSNVATGWCVECDPDCGSGDMFKKVVDQLDADDLPALVYDPRASRAEIRCYPNGLNHDHEYVCHAIKDEEFSQVKLDQELDSFHYENLRSPGANSGYLWRKQSQCRPVKDAEKHVQWGLICALKAALKSCYITSEEKTEAGRTDVMIRDVGTQASYLAALELKVFRSFTETGSSVSSSKTDEAIQKGLTQVIGYRAERSANLGYLCCYDLRKSDHGDGCFEHVKQRADDHGIELRRWFVPHSEEQYREAEYGP